MSKVEESIARATGKLEKLQTDALGKPIIPVKMEVEEEKQNSQNEKPPSKDKKGKSGQNGKPKKPMKDVSGMSKVERSIARAKGEINEEQTDANGNPIFAVDEEGEACVEIVQNFKLSPYCRHGPSSKMMCYHCMYLNKITAKHEPFDFFLKTQMTQNSTKTQTNCFFTHPGELQYQVKTFCKFCGRGNPPRPDSMCYKCMPPAVNIMRQKYRHVDNVMFYNQSEIQKFVNSWDFSSQKMAWLYGWYALDENYKDGVRCIVEAIYSPP